MTGRGKLSDAELSKKLGHYQKMSRIWILVGLFGALSGTVSYFAVQDTALKAILTGVLFFGGVCCAVFLGGSAQKKLQALIQEQFGDFFRAEWEKAFGPDMHTPEMCVDEPFLRTFHLLDGQWEECTVENFHEGDYRGVHFSAANVRLDHVYERGCGHDGYETCHEMIFKGLVLRCETRTPAPSPPQGFPQKGGRADEVEVMCLRVQAWNRAREIYRRRVGSRQITRKTRSIWPVGVYRTRRVVGKGRPQRGHGIHHGTERRLFRE